VGIHTYHTGIHTHHTHTDASSKSIGILGIHTSHTHTYHTHIHTHMSYRHTHTHTSSFSFSLAFALAFALNPPLSLHPHPHRQTIRDAWKEKRRVCVFGGGKVAHDTPSSCNTLQHTSTHYCNTPCAEYWFERSIHWRCSCSCLLAHRVPATTILYHSSLPPPSHQKQNRQSQQNKDA